MYRLANSTSTPQSRNRGSVFDKVFRHKSAAARHQAAPLAKEREAFLEHLIANGLRIERLNSTASGLLQVIRLLHLTRLRKVTPAEIRRAANFWIRRHSSYHNILPGPTSRERFEWVASRWLRFLGRLKVPRPREPFGRRLVEYTRALRVEMGLSEASIEANRHRAKHFLTWLAKRSDRFSSIAINDIDSYLFRKGAPRKLHTIASECRVLRKFFHYAEERNWCRPGLAASIKAPMIRGHTSEAQGPKWDDVVQLLNASSGPEPNEIRAHALLQLLATYGLRAGEVARLQIKDIDWPNKVVTVQRSKRGGIQQFPLQDCVGHAIRRYIDEVRPKCSHANLFMTLYGPYRPVDQNSVSSLVCSRILKSKIQTKHFGPQALRHACATRLLSLGASYSDIADYLGHRNTRTVQVYAKLDVRRLREVSELDLLGAL